jgi:hypothetical protein
MIGCSQDRGTDNWWFKIVKRLVECSKDRNRPWNSYTMRKRP